MKRNWNSIPSAATAALPPWQQLAALVRNGDAARVRCENHPQVILRGDRAYLRSLRASEMTAWEAAGKNFTPNPASIA